MFSASKYLPKRLEPAWGLLPRLGAYRPALLTSGHLSKHLTTLSKALASVSTNLSIAALLGLALVPVLPRDASSVLAKRSPAGTPSIEVVRAKPVPVPDVQDPAAASPADQVRELAQQQEAAVQLAARRSREPLPRPEPESGDIGKPGATHASRTPIPPPEPQSDAAKVEPPPPNVWTDTEIIDALRDCLKRLAPLGAEIDIAPAVKDEQCGAPAPVLLKRIGSRAGRVEFQPPPMLNCAMVAGLHSWIEKTLQPAAQELLGTSIVRLKGTAGYACRNRNGSRAFTDRLSEHALANAIDIMGFVTADGRTIEVLNKWGPTARDIREQKERVAEAKVVAKESAKDALEVAKEAARQARKEADDAVKAAANAPRNKRKQLQTEAERKKQDAERKSDEVERLGDEAQMRAAEAQRTAGLQKLGEALESAKQAARQASKEADDAAKAAARAPRSKRQQLQSEAARKKQEAERKSAEVERLAEEAEAARAAEARRGSMRTAGLQKLGKGVDVKATDAKATPTTAAAADAARPTAEATFLRRLHKGACGTFGTVLGPEANEAHRNHFHFDMAPRRRSAFCE
jgi:hypothetical protein